MGLLNTFCNCANQAVNLLKSNILFSKNVKPNTKSHITRVISISTYVKDIKYLGLPLFDQERKKENFQFIMDHLEDKLSRWKTRHLSKVGRLTCIKAMGLVLPIYAMQFESFSAALSNKVDTIVRKFWWGHDQKELDLYLKDWNAICLPKSRVD